MRCGQRARVIVSTYNEPLITSEWAVAVFKEAKAAGLTTGYVSNGNGTPQVLEYLRPWVDLYKVDLKSFDDRHYRQLGGRLEPILDTIRRLHAMGFWVEIVTLLIPGFNDSRDELTRLTAFVAERVARHPVARHGVPRRLQDDRPREHDRGDAARGGGHRPRQRPALRLRRQPAGRASATSRTRAARRAASSSSRATAITSATIASRPTAAARRARRRSRPLEPAVRRPDHLASFLPGCRFTAFKSDGLKSKSVEV